VLYKSRQKRGEKYENNNRMFINSWDTTACILEITKPEYRHSRDKFGKQKIKNSLKIVNTNFCVKNR